MTIGSQVRLNIRRNVLSLKAAIAVLAVIFVNALDVVLEMVLARGIRSSYYYYVSIFFPSMLVVQLAVIAFPVAASFPDDWNYGISKYSAIRSSPRKYALSKVISAYLSFVIIALVAAVLYFGLFAAFHQLASQGREFAQESAHNAAMSGALAMINQSSR